MRASESARCCDRDVRCTIKQFESGSSDGAVVLVGQLDLAGEVVAIAGLQVAARSGMSTTRARRARRRTSRRACATYVVVGQDAVELAHLVREAGAGPRCTCRGTPSRRRSTARRGRARARVNAILRPSNCATVEVERRAGVGREQPDAARARRRHHAVADHDAAAGARARRTRRGRRRGRESSWNLRRACTRRPRGGSSRTPRCRRGAGDERGQRLGGAEHDAPALAAGARACLERGDRPRATDRRR